MRRAIVTSALTGVGAAAAFAVSELSGGFLGAGSFVMAMFMALLALGGLAAVAVNGWFDRVDRRWTLDADTSIRGRWRPTLIWRNCRSCSKRMTQIDFLWVCDRCDRVLANR